MVEGGELDVEAERKVAGVAVVFREGERLLRVPAPSLSGELALPELASRLLADVGQHEAVDPMPHVLPDGLGTPAAEAVVRPADVHAPPAAVDRFEHLLRRRRWRGDAAVQSLE